MAVDTDKEVIGMNTARDKLLEGLSSILTEALLLAHYPHLQATGEGRIVGKCLDSPCIEAWSGMRRLVDEVFDLKLGE